MQSVFFFFLTGAARVFHVHVLPRRKAKRYMQQPRNILPNQGQKPVVRSVQNQPVQNQQPIQNVQQRQNVQAPQRQVPHASPQKPHPIQTQNVGQSHNQPVRQNLPNPVPRPVVAQNQAPQRGVPPQPVSVQRPQGQNQASVASQNIPAQQNQPIQRGPPPQNRPQQNQPVQNQGQAASRIVPQRNPNQGQQQRQAPAQSQQQQDEPQIKTDQNCNPPPRMSC